MTLRFFFFAVTLWAERDTDGKPFVRYPER